MVPSNSPLRSTPFLRRISRLIVKEGWTVVYGACLVASLIIVAVWWFPIARPSRPKIEPEIKPAPVSDVVAARERTLKFFEARVVAELETADRENRMAAERCIARIEQNFLQYRSGVDGFIDEITGFRSRFGIMKRMPGQWWNGDDRVADYIAEKFERHLFSEKKLTDDLRSALDAFRDDIRANQRGLLTRTQAAIAESDLPPIQMDDAEVFFAKVSEKIATLASEEAQTSVADGVTALVIAEAGSTATGMLAGRIIASLATSAATTAATTGGATAGTATAGAAGGSIVPGAGTAIGFAAGFVVGFAIDYWMNEKSAAKLRTELLLYINKIESDLLLGPAELSAEDPQQTGIKRSIDITCQQLRDGVHARLYEIIVLEQES